MSRQAECAECGLKMYGMHKDTPDEITLEKGCPRCGNKGPLTVKPTVDTRPDGARHLKSQTLSGDA